MGNFYLQYQYTLPVFSDKALSLKFSDKTILDRHDIFYKQIGQILGLSDSIF